VVAKTFRAVITGRSASVKGTGRGADGSTIECSGGSTLLKVDRLDTGGPQEPIIGSPSQLGLDTFKRRCYTNSEYTVGNNVIYVPALGSWYAGQTKIINILPTTISAELLSIDGFYAAGYDSSTQTWVNENLIDISVTFSVDKKSITVIIGASCPLVVRRSIGFYVQFTVKHLASLDGFKDIPTKLLQVRNNSINVPIAVYGNNTNISENIIPGRPPAFVKYSGGNYTENVEFGHDLIIYQDELEMASAIATNIQCPLGKLHGYDISGVKSIQRLKDSGEYGSFQPFDCSRTADGSNYSITNIGTIDGESAQNIKITLQTKTKLFELSKQGRGVVDIYEYIEVTVTDNEISQAYFLDTQGKPIIAIGSYAMTLSGVPAGTTYAYRVNGSNEDRIIVSLEQNVNLPILQQSAYVNGQGFPTKVRIYSSNLPAGATLKVPVLVHSSVTLGESYSFFYETRPYQGNLSSLGSVTGKIESQGTSIITSEGSGKILNYTYTSGTATFQNGSRTVLGENTEWLSYAQVGDYIRVASSRFFYRVIAVVSDTELTLSETYSQYTSYSETPSGAVSYEVSRPDTPLNNLSNVIDRLPSLLNEDHKATSEELNFGSYSTSVLETAPIHRIQCPTDTISGDFEVGKISAFRGMSGFVLTNGVNDFIKMGKRTPGIEYVSIASLTGYKKVYQVYLLNLNSSGRLYLLIVAGETGKTISKTILNHNTLLDTVDIFELIGRPLIKTT
jgi:hypothetical protein